MLSFSDNNIFCFIILFISESQGNSVSKLDLTHFLAQFNILAYLSLIALFSHTFIIFSALFITLVFSINVHLIKSHKLSLAQSGSLTTILFNTAHIFANVPFIISSSHHFLTNLATILYLVLIHL
jgi:hypothetical protein